MYQKSPELIAFKSAQTPDTEGNWKQWKWKPEMENGNGNSQNLMQGILNNHLLKIAFVQDHLFAKTASTKSIVGHTCPHDLPPHYCDQVLSYT